MVYSEGSPYAQISLAADDCANAVASHGFNRAKSLVYQYLERVGIGCEIINT